jgi:hypothetical protein
MKYMDWAAMGAASSAYAEASRARSENQDLWHQNQMLSNELARLQDQMDQHQDSLDALKNDIARRKAMEEFQAWIEEFIYKFDKTTTEISSGSKDPVYDYGVIASFLDIINKNSLDTSRIRGLENKSAFEKTFVKAQNLFVQLEQTPEFQNHIRQLEQNRIERERLIAEKATSLPARSNRRQRKLGWIND